jgi:hypothetical protein
MMATLATDGAVLPVEEYALTDVDLHVTFCSPAWLARAVAERALGIRYLDDSLACTYGAVFRLHHIRYSITSVI